MYNYSARFHMLVAKALCTVADGADEKFSGQQAVRLGSVGGWFSAVERDACGAGVLCRVIGD